MTDPREELLQRLLDGELSPDDVEAKAAFERDPELLKDWKFMQIVQDQLDGASAEESEILARLEPDPRHAERATRVLTGIWGEESTPRGTSQPSRWLRVAIVTGVAAAAGILLWVVLTGEDRPVADPPPVFLSADVRDLQPSGLCTGFESFSWSGNLPQDGVYRITIENAETGEAVVSRHAVQGTSWKPSREELLKMGKRIRWTVQVFEPNKTDPKASADAEAFVP